MAYILVNCDGELVNLTECCRRKNISFNAVWCYKRKHPDMDYEKIIDYYENRVSVKADKYAELRNRWYRIKDRCNNPKHPCYHNYGGRGIKICDRWLDFENFYRDLYESYKRHVEEYGEADTTLDRINNDIGYQPDNCRWCTRKEQNNNRRNNIILDTGETLKQYCENNNLDYLTIHARLGLGWDLKRAISKPIKHTKQRIKTPTGEKITEMCKRNNIQYGTFKHRIYAGWTFDEAMYTPVKK